MNKASKTEKEKFMAHVDPITWRGVTFTSYGDAPRVIRLHSKFDSRFSGSITVEFKQKKPVHFEAEIRLLGVTAKADSTKSAEAALETCAAKLKMFAEAVGA